MVSNNKLLHSAVVTLKAAMANDPPVADGRRERSVASRRKILEAAVELIAEGNPDPSAAAVAARAGVGLRTVFRHFQDKETILREIVDLLIEAYQPIIVAPYASQNWREQLDEQIERRCAINEAVVVFRLSSILARYRSSIVAEKSRRLHVKETRRLDHVLPPYLRTNTAPGRAIMVVTSFDTWRFLRQDEELSSGTTLAVIKEMVANIIECEEAKR